LLFLHPNNLFVVNVTDDCIVSLIYYDHYVCRTCIFACTNFLEYNKITKLSTRKNSVWPSNSW